MITLYYKTKTEFYNNKLTIKLIISDNTLFYFHKSFLLTKEDLDRLIIILTATKKKLLKLEKLKIEKDKNE